MSQPPYFVPGQQPLGQQQVGAQQQPALQNLQLQPQAMNFNQFQQNQFPQPMGQLPQHQYQFPPNMMPMAQPQVQQFQPDYFFEQVYSFLTDIKNVSCLIEYIEKKKKAEKEAEPISNSLKNLSSMLAQFYVHNKPQQTQAFAPNPLGFQPPNQNFGFPPNQQQNQPPPFAATVIPQNIPAPFIQPPYINPANPTINPTNQPAQVPPYMQGVQKNNNPIAPPYMSGFNGKGGVPIMQVNKPNYMKGDDFPNSDEDDKADDKKRLERLEQKRRILEKVLNDLKNIEK